MKQLFIILITMLICSTSFGQLKRFYDANHKALKAGVTSSISLDCGENKKNEWNNSANTNNLVWTGDTVRFKTTQELKDFYELRFITNVKFARKIFIRKAMIALGEESKLDAILTNARFKKHWDDAGTYVDLSDPMVAEALTSSNIDIVAVKKQVYKIIKEKRR